MIFHIIIFIIILLLCLRAYIRIKHGFWAIQPVIHSYDLFKVFYKSGIINKELPEINKYCDFLNIQTYKYDDLSDTNIKLIQSFISENYLNNQYSHYNLTNKYFNACFKGHNCFSYLSIYGNFTFSKEENNKISIKDIDGVITGRPINLTIKNLTKIPVYYIDFLCVSKSKRKKGLASQLIQTHEYNQRHSNKNVKVCLFKREGELTGIVPLTIFNNCFFEISTELTSMNTQTYSQIKYITVNKVNFYLFIDFLIKYYYLFDCVVVVEPSNLLSLIEAKHLFIVIGILNGNIISSFFFKDYNVTYNKGKIIQLEGSLIDPKYLNNVTEFFSKSLSHINKKCLAKYILIESLSNNVNLLNELKNINIFSKLTTKSAYFLYNYSQTPIQPEKTLFLL